MRREVFPSKEECFELMDQSGMLDNIITHSLEVAKVALFLSRELNRRGQRIDLALVEAASLLHDIAKTECLRTKEDHAVAGCRLLKGMGYEKLGEVVAQHIRVATKGDPLWVTEEEIVNYADKRVEHDRIVSLEERFRGLRERYGRGQDSLKQLEALQRGTYEIEAKIFSILEMDPTDLAHLS
jgi:uncharacterized protein